MAVAQPTIFEILANDNAGTNVVLTFEGTGAPDGHVTIYDSLGNAIASGLTAHDGSFTISTSALANSTHNLTLTTTDALSIESAPTSAVIASVAPGGSSLQSLDVSQLPDFVVVDISATSSAVTLTGNGGSDTFFGNDAGDTVNAGNGGNNVSTGAGNDTINGGSGGDTILSGAGNDIVHSGGNSSIDAGDGDDTITAGGGDTVFGGKGSDSITGSASDAAAYGGGASDYLIERTGANTFSITSKSTAPEFGTVATPGTDSLTGVGTLLFNFDPISNSGTSISSSDLIGLLSDTDTGANVVDDSSAPGTVAHITAHAIDGSGDGVTYQLLTGGVPFAIDSSTGIITVSGALDHVSHPSYDLEVKATSADGSFTRQTFTVTVTGADVTPVNSVPGAQTVNEDTNLVFSSGHGNAISVSDADAGTGAETITLTVLHGTLTLGSTAGLTSVLNDGSANVTLSGTIADLNNALGGLTYRGDADFNGLDTLSVTTNDNGSTGTGGPKSDTDTVSISVTAVSDVANDALTTAEDTAITANVLTGTNGASADNFEGPASIASVTQGTHGAVTFSANGNVTYTPDADYNGADSFTYTVANDGANETATVNVAVTAVSDVVNDALTTAEDTAITANVLTGTNGASADNFEGPASITGVTQGAHGAVTFSANGNVTYTPDADYNGADSFTYTVANGGANETATVNVAVTAVSDVLNDALTTAEDTAITANVLTGTNGASSDNFEGPASIASVTQGAHGAVAFNANGNVTYTPNADYNGADSFTYTVANGGANETATVNVTVVPVSDVTNDTLATAEDTAITANVLTGTNGASADNFEGPASIASVTQGAHGSVSFNANGNVTYTPNADYNGADSFTYTMANGGPNETATVNVTVTAVSDVTNDALSTAEDTAITANVLTGTSGASADNFEGAASIASVTQGVHGAVAFNANGNVTYTPTADYNGPDSFTYTVANGGANETATVNVAVTAVNNAPVNTVPGARSVNEETNLAISGLSISDVDAGSGSLTTTLSVGNGTLTVAFAGGAAVSGSGSSTVTLTGTVAQINTTLGASNNVVYRGASNFNGADTLTITTNDNGNSGSGGAKSDTDTVAITVAAVNDPPVGSGAGGSILYLENQSPTAVDPGLTVSDPDSANFVGALVAIAGNYQAGQDVLGFTNQNGISGSFNAATGVLTLSGTSSVANYQAALAGVTYFNSSDNPSTAARTVDYQVNDGSGFVDIGSAGVNVQAVNDGPVITSNGGGDTASISAAENTTAVTTVVASDPDSSVTYSIIGGSDAGKFQINASTGALSFIAAPDFEIPRDSDHNNTYVVQVQASDGSLTDTQTITVGVTDVSDPLPTLHWTRSVDIGPHPAGWLPSGIGDFNADGISDVVWFNATTGNIDIWKLADGQWAGSSGVGDHPPGYQPAGVGDFNHDGTSDILWFNASTRDAEVWKMSNGQWAGSVDIGTHPAGYTPSGVGDFNNDGTSDLLWYNASTRDAEIWKISNGQWAGSVDVGTHPAGYQPAVTGDFNGDGTSDIAWYNSTTGDVDIWKLSNGQWAGSTSLGAHPLGWQPLGAADFNLDGTSDMVWYNPTTNNVEVWLIKNGQWTGSVDIGSHPPGSTAVGVGDFDNNGVSDILWRSPSDGHIENWMLAFS